MYVFLFSWIANKVDPNPDSDEPMNLLLLLREVRAAIGRRGLLTMAVTPMPNLYRNYAYDYGGLVDWVNVMTYDITGPWGQVTGFPSALFPDFTTPHGTDAVSSAAWRWFYAGMPRHKISMGAAFYGYGWSVEPNSPNGGLFQRSLGIATNVPFADGSGAFVWRWLRQAGGVLERGIQLPMQGWARQWRNPANMATLYNADQGDILIVDDVDSLREKARWTRRAGLYVFSFER
jgi:GH18 family chitinase